MRWPGVSLPTPEPQPRPGTVDADMLQRIIEMHGEIKAMHDEIVALKVEVKDLKEANRLLVRELTAFKKINRKLLNTLHDSRPKLHLDPKLQAQEGTSP